MSLIIAEHITKSFGALHVLQNVSFRVAETDRIGVVGPNGEGKTTLLKLIGGMAEITDGQLHRAKSCRVAYLPQDPPCPAGQSIYDAMEAVFADLKSMEQTITDLAGQLHDKADDEEFLARYGELQTEFEDRGGYDYHNRIEQVLTGLNFTRDQWAQPLAELSGGQRTRAYLATLLLQSPDLLMLDEPTNHLDMESVEWLEGWLKKYQKALLVVSHDRYFLDRVTNITWEIAGGGMEVYRGSYSDYWPKRQERYEQRLSQWKQQEETIAKERDFIQRHIAGQRTKEAQGRRTRLERFLRDEAIAKPPEPDTIALKLESAKRSGEIALDASDLSIGYAADQPLLQTERLQVERGQRIAIVGANGIGKTTLLRTILGELDKLGGKVRLGSNVQIGYLSQSHAELPAGEPILHCVTTATPEGCTDGHARSVLGSLQLRGDDVYKTPDQLSGGQRSRVILSRLTVQNANFLLLDEPTNHLDMASTEILQNALRDFDGTVLFVSHDRYLIQAVATHIWIVKGSLADYPEGNLQAIPGGWETFLAWRERQDQQQTEQVQEAKKQTKDDFKQARKEANRLKNLRRRHEQLEEQIHTAEEELETLNEQISAAGEAGDMEAITKLGETYQQKNQALQTLWQEWEQLGEELE